MHQQTNRPADRQKRNKIMKKSCTFPWIQGVDGLTSTDYSMDIMCVYIQPSSVAVGYTPPPHFLVPFLLYSDVINLTEKMFLCFKIAVTNFSFSRHHIQQQQR